MSEKVTIQVFEWEILAFIRVEGERAWRPKEDGPYFLHYDRATYESARRRLIELKKAELMKQGKAVSNLQTLGERSPNPVPAWGWE